VVGGVYLFYHKGHEEHKGGWEILGLGSLVEREGKHTLGATYSPITRNR
jgi:hypothetical protein